MTIYGLERYPVIRVSVPISTEPITPAPLPAWSPNGPDAPLALELTGKAQEVSR